MRVMRVLHLVGRSQRRGAELVALELAPALDRLGHVDFVRACAPGFDGTLDPQLPALTSRVAMDPRGLLAAARELRHVLRAEPVDVVLAHGGWAVQVAALARGRGGRGPSVVWQRILGLGEGIGRRGRGAWWRFVVGRVDAVVSLSSDMADEVRALGFDGPVWAIPNFRTPDRFVAVDRGRAAGALRAELQLTPSTPLLGLVGHLIEQKRPERAVAVLAEVREHELDAHLVVAGVGPLEADFVATARRAGVEDAVHLVGHRGDVEQVLGGIDLLLLTSDAEGIPGIVIEAAMTGCPVVTFPLGAVATVVDDGRTGVVLPRADTSLMADTCVTLLQDPARRAAMSRAARAGASQFTTEHAAKEYAHRLEALVAARGG
jgi:glycosyltransferase involved in cell wall biosynthesis